MVVNNIRRKRKQENDNIICVHSIQTNETPGDITESKQKHGIMYEDEELRPYLVDPHKQTLIDLQYHVEKLKTDGHEVLIFMGTNQTEEQLYQTPTHN
jgi:hypothetical protein